MYKYINIRYKIFLTEFIYNKTISFYIKKYFFLKIRLIWSPNWNNWINSIKKFDFNTIRFSFYFWKYTKKKSIISIWWLNIEKNPNATKGGNYSSCMRPNPCNCCFMLLVNRFQVSFPQSWHSSSVNGNHIIVLFTAHDARIPLAITLKLVIALLPC